MPAMSFSVARRWAKTWCTRGCWRLLQACGPAAISLPRMPPTSLGHAPHVLGSFLEITGTSSALCGVCGVVCVVCVVLRKW